MGNQASSRARHFQRTPPDGTANGSLPNFSKPRDDAEVGLDAKRLMSACEPDVGFALCFDGRHIYYTSLVGGVPTKAAHWQCIDMTKALVAKFADFTTAMSDVLDAKIQAQIRAQHQRLLDTQEQTAPSRKADHIGAFQWRLSAAHLESGELSSEIAEMQARDGITFTDEPDTVRSHVWYTDPTCAPAAGGVEALLNTFNEPTWRETHAAAWQAAARRSAEIIASAARVQRVHVTPNGDVVAYVSLKRIDGSIHDNGCVVRLPFRYDDDAAGASGADSAARAASKCWLDVGSSELIHNVSYSRVPHTAQSFANDGSGFVRACLAAPFLGHLGGLSLSAAERVEGALHLGCGARAFAWQLDPSTAACQWFCGPRNWIEKRADPDDVPRVGLADYDRRTWWRAAHVVSRGFLPPCFSSIDAYNAAQVMHHRGEPQVAFAGWICVTATGASVHRLQLSRIEEVSSDVSISMLDLRFGTMSRAATAVGVSHYEPSRGGAWTSTGSGGRTICGTTRGCLPSTAPSLPARSASRATQSTAGSR